MTCPPLKFISLNNFVHLFWTRCLLWADCFLGGSRGGVGGARALQKIFNIHFWSKFTVVYGYACIWQGSHIIVTEHSMTNDVRRGYLNLGKFPRLYTQSLSHWRIHEQEMVTFVHMTITSSFECIFCTVFYQSFFDSLFLSRIQAFQEIFCDNAISFMVPRKGQNHLQSQTFLQIQCNIQIGFNVWIKLARFPVFWWNQNESWIKSFNS